MAKYVKLLPLLIALALLSGVPAAVSGQQAVTVGFSATEYTVSEDDGTVSITVEASPAPTQPVQVRILTLDETATFPNDYRPVVTIVTFAVTQTAETVDVTIVDNNSVEDSESFSVRLETILGQTGVTISESNGEATVTIEDNDPATVGLQLTEYRVSEQSESVVIGMEITSPRVSCPIAFPFTVRLLTDDGTAVAGEDYRTVPADVTFDSCDRVRAVSFPIIDDSRIEDAEAFTVRLERTSTLPAGITLSPDTATIEIQDDDGTLVQFEKLYYPAEEDNGTVQIAMELVSPDSSCPSDVPISLGLETSDATAESSLDYVAVDTTVTFARCESRQTFNIPLINDGRLENNERFTVRLLRTESTDLRIRIDSSTAVVEIADTGDDTALLGFESEEYTVDEGDSFDLAVNLSGDATCPVEFPFDVLLGSAIPLGARSSIAKPTSRVAFKSCDLRRDLPIDTSDIEATAELRFELGRTSRLDSRIAIGQSTAAAYIVDTGGTTEAFEDLAADENDGPWGIWSDRQTTWISNESDHKIYAYDLDTKARDSDKDFDTLDDADNDQPTGIWSNGTTMWVADYDDGKIYAYQVSDKARDPDKDFDTLSAAGNANPTGLWSNGATMWVADFADGKIYAYNMATKTQDSDKEFNARATGNNHPEGIWSNGTTMWVADSHSSPGGRKIYAYDMTTKEREEEKEFNSLIAAGQSNPKGIWSNGDIMWVVDKGEDKIYAYYFPVDPEVPVTVRPTSTTTTGGSPETEETDAAHPSTISAQCVSEEADEDAVDIELGITIADSWASGCPSITRGGRLAKYYSFNLPITTAVAIALDSHLDTYLVLRSGGLSGKVVEQDDDSGPGNNSLISDTLTAGQYTIEATTFYADGVEAAFTLSVLAVPRVLYEGPPLTVRLLPTLPRGTLEMTIEDEEGFGSGAGPLGGVQTTDGSSGTVLLALPKTAWVDYGEITVEVRQSGSWAAHTRADEQGMLTGGGPGPNLGPALLGLVQILGRSEGALQLIGSLVSLSADGASATEPDESLLDAVFRTSYANCVSQVTVPWLVPTEEATGVRVTVPVDLSDSDYLSLAASFVAGDGDPALTQLHDLLDTCQDTPECQPPEPAAE